MTGSRMRTVWIAILGLLVVVVIAAVFLLKGTQEPAQAMPWRWENRITGLSAEIDGAWIKPKRMETETPAYMFTDVSDAASLIFGVEEYADMDLRSYVDALVMSNANNMVVPEQGEYGQFEGYEAWIGHGNLVINDDYAVTVRVVRIRGNFWRTLMIQPESRNELGALLDKLETRVWQTILPVGGSDEAGAVSAPASDPVPETETE